MDQVVQAINELSSRYWVDYLAIFAPFVLSIVAVWVSISTARRQNKIALFEKRFEFLTTLKKCIDFSNGINNVDNSYALQVIFVVAFDNEVISDVGKDAIYRSAICLYNKIETIFSQGAFLFNFDFKKVTHELAELLIELLAMKFDDENFDACLLEYKEISKHVKDELIPQVEQVLKLF